MVTISITAARCVAWRCVARDIETPIVFLFFVYYRSDSDSAEQSERS